MIKFNKTTQGFNNMWTQLKDIVSTKSLYSEEDYAALSGTQKEQYLTMLYANHDALAHRLPDEYNSEYIDAQLRFDLLAVTNKKYATAEALQNPEYQAKLNEAVDTALNSKLTKDAGADKTWVDWLVENKYSGDYTAFAKDYSGENAKTYEDALAEMVPAEFELSEDKFEEGLAGVVGEREALYSEYVNSANAAYDNTLKYVRQQIKAKAEKEAYENASTLEKIFTTIVQVPTLIAAEVVEIVEGIGDTLITIAGGIAETFTFGNASTEWAETAIKYDWWAPETWLNVETSMSYLNKYAGENAARWIYEIGVNLVDMIPLAIPGAGQILYYASSFGKNMESELQQGYSFGEAVAVSIGSTAIEYATEKISGTKYLGGGIFKKWEKIGNKNLGLKLLHDGLGEGLEEVISGIGSDLWHGAITGDYTLNTGEGWAQIAKSFAIGAIVGGIMVGGEAAVQHGVIANTAVKLKAANGSTIDLPASKAAVILDFVQKTGTKIESGKTVSQRTQDRFDILKDMVVVKTEATARNIDKFLAGENLGRAVQTVELSEGNYESKIQPKIQRKLHLLELLKNRNDKTNKVQTEESINAEADKLNKSLDGAGTDTAAQAFAESGLALNEFAAYLFESADQETRERFQKDFQVSGAMTLGKLTKMFGEDAVTSGVSLWAQYCDKTINEVIELLQLGSDNSAYTLDTADKTKLNEYFPGSEFVMVSSKPTSEAGVKYSEMMSAIDSLHGAFEHFKRYKVQLFFTTGSSVATSFFVGDTLYVNAAWLSGTDTGRLKDIIITKYCAENARRILDINDKNGTVRQLLLEAVNRIDNPNRSPEIMLQELCYIMLFQKDNILLRQLLSAMENKRAANAVIKYFDKLRLTFASGYIQKAAGLGLSNMVATCNELFETDDNEAQAPVLPENANESVANIIDAYQEHEFRAFPLITGKNGVPKAMAKAQAMYHYMQKTFGFNKKLDLTKRINWIKQFTDPKNFDGDGYTRLLAELEKYRSVPSTSGYVYGTVPAAKTTGELLNYFLDNVCGLMVFSNGTITQSEFTTKVLNIPALEAAAKTADTTIGASRSAIGTVKDFIGSEFSAAAPPAIQNAKVYVTSESDSGAYAYLLGDLNTGMILVINIADIKNMRGKTMLVGGKSLILDESGELERNADGSFKTQDNTKQISKLAYVIGHEVGHTVGMWLGNQGTFDEDSVARAYASISRRLSPTDRKEFVASIKNWLIANDSVKPELRNFARMLGVSKEDISSNPDLADSKIKEYIARLEKYSESIPKNDTLISLFRPLSRYLYFSGFAHEMYANGRVESAAREDTIRSELFTSVSPVDDETFNGTKLVTNSQLGFIRILDGAPLFSPVDSDFLNEYIADIQDTPENTTKRVLSEITAVDELADELGVKFASELIDPNFWRRKAKKVKNNTATRANFIDAIESNYDCTYDSITKEFRGGYVSNMARMTPAPKDGQGFAVMYRDDGTTLDAGNHASYNSGSKINTFISYQPASKNARPSMVISLTENSRVTKGNVAPIAIDGNDIPVPKGTGFIILADGKPFSTVTAAKRYLRAQNTTSKNGDFESVFDRVIEQATSIGRQVNYADDTVYIMPDGTIYNLDITMRDWGGFADMALAESSKVEVLLGERIDGEFTELSEEGITDKLAAFLDEKRIVRLYRSGDKWTAYGTPNKLQEGIANGLHADYKSEFLYGELESDRKLFITLEGDKPKVSIHLNDWTSPGWREVDWKSSIWYESLRQIMTKYDIRYFRDFERIGFSQDFINGLKEGKNLNEKFFLDYIRDGSNTDYSKNILIANSPGPRPQGGGDWKNNPNIRTMEDARNYWKHVISTAPIMPVQLDESGKKVSIIYNSELELSQAIAKAKGDPANIPSINQWTEVNTMYASILDDELAIQVLNQDAEYGLTLDRASFVQMAKVIKRYYYSLTRTGRRKKDTGLEVDVDDGDDSGSYLRGESTEIPSEFLNVDKKGPVDNIFSGFVHEIEQAMEIDDVEERNAALKAIADRVKALDGEYEYKSLLLATISNRLEGTDRTQHQQYTLSQLKTRIERFKKMEKNSPEQLKERRHLIRLYESVKNTKLKKLLAQDKDYYVNYLKLLDGIGTYSVNMNQNFASFYKRANRVREEIADKESFDKRIDKIREIRSAILRTDMEYPGWYENYENLLQYANDWISGETQTNGKTFAAARADIINFVNSFEKDLEFRQKIAEREKVPHYIFAKQVKGALFTDAELEQFKNIPDNIKPVHDFPKDARKLYERLEKASAKYLAKFLSKNKTITGLTKQFGQDFIYNIQQLYNSKIAPIPGTGMSQMRKTFWSDIMDDLEDINDENEEGALTKDVFEEIINVNTKDSYQKTLQAVNKMKREDYTSYRNLAADNADRIYRFLAEGKEVSDSEREAVLKEAGEYILSYIWPRDTVYNSIRVNTTGLPIEYRNKLIEDLESYRKTKTYYEYKVAVNPENARIDLHHVTAEDHRDIFMAILATLDDTAIVTSSEIITADGSTVAVTDLTGLPQSKRKEAIGGITQQNIITADSSKIDLSKLSAEAREIVMNLVDEQFGNDLMFAELLTKYSPTSEKPHHSSVGAIGATPLPGAKQKSAVMEEAEKYQNKYYQLRAKLTNALTAIRTEMAEETAKRVTTRPSDSDELAPHSIVSINTTDLSTEMVDAIFKPFKSKSGSELKLFGSFLVDTFLEHISSSYITDIQRVAANAGFSSENLDKLLAAVQYVESAIRNKRGIDEIRANVSKQGWRDSVAAFIDLLLPVTYTDKSEISAFMSKKHETKLSGKDGGESVEKLYAYAQQVLHDAVVMHMQKILGHNFAVQDTTREILRPTDIYGLGAARLYRTTKAILLAYYNFMDNPKTDRSIEKFRNEVGVALEYGTVDKRLPGSNERVSIEVPIEYLEPPLKPIKTTNVDEELKPIFEGKLIEASTEAREALERFRKTLKLEEDALSFVVDNYRSQAEKLRQIRISRDKYKIRREYEIKAFNEVVVEAAPDTVEFNSDTGTFVNTLDGTQIKEQDVKFNQLSDGDFKAYLDYMTQKGLKEGWLARSTHGNIIDPETKKIVAYDTEYGRTNAAGEKKVSLADLFSGKVLPQTAPAPAKKKSSKATNKKKANTNKKNAKPKASLADLFGSGKSNYISDEDIERAEDMLVYNVDDVVRTMYSVNADITTKLLNSINLVNTRYPTRGLDWNDKEWFLQIVIDGDSKKTVAERLGLTRAIIDKYYKMMEKNIPHAMVDNPQYGEILGYRVEDRTMFVDDIPIFSRNSRWLPAKFYHISRSEYIEGDFEDAIDTSGISDYIEDDVEFEPLERINVAKETKAEPKGTWEYKEPENKYYRISTGLSENTAKILDYQPRNWEIEHKFDSEQFLEDNEAYLNKFVNSHKDMLAYVAKIESNPVIPLDSPQEPIVFALLNKISNLARVTVGDAELADRAEALVVKLKSAAGRVLGMVKAYGTTSVEQLVAVCSKMLNLSPEENKFLANCAVVQRAAIANGNYKRATDVFDEVMKILKKHQSELPVSMNPFAKSLTPEERTTRWHNIVERVTSWRYFAMLGAPTTFLTKNFASNVIISGLNAAAEGIGSVIGKIRKQKTLSKNYTFKDKFDSVVKTGDKLSLLSTADTKAVLASVNMTAGDAKFIDVQELTDDLNAFIKTRFKVQKVMPSAGQVAAYADSWLRKNYYQYKMDKSATNDIKSLVKEKIDDSGLIDGLMENRLSKYDTGYQIKGSRLRTLVVNPETSLAKIAEADAAILADAVRSDTPFSKNPNNILNRYYNFIFRSMNWGDKKFIKPKILKTVAKLIASNMTAAEIAQLKNGDAAAKAKLNEFVQYAIDDAMTTYFRGNSEFQKKVMQLFEGHPIVQLIFGTIVPFPRMAINTMNTALSYSPVGFIKALMLARNSEDAFTRLKVNKELGKAFTGTALIAIGAILAACGLLDFDDDDKYSDVQLVIGNTVRISINDFMPAATPFIIGATMTSSATGGVWDSVYNGGKVLLEATLLGEAIEIFGGNKNAMDVAVDTFASFTNQFIPSIFRHMARVIDPTEKKYSSNRGVKIIQRIASSIPVVSMMVPSKIDPYTGNAVYQNTGASEGWARVLSFINALAPAKITTNIQSNIESESKAVGAPTTGPAKTYKIDGVEYTIPEDLYRDYQTLRAKLYSKYAQDTINTTKYKNMSMEQKRAKLKQLQNKATQEARKQLNIGK